MDKDAGMTGWTQLILSILYDFAWFCDVPSVQDLDNHR